MLCVFACVCSQSRIVIKSIEIKIFQYHSTRFCLDREFRFRIFPSTFENRT